MPDRERSAERSRVVRDIEQLAVPLGTTEPTGETERFEPLRDEFEGKRVVGLGESTHGTREFFRLKHALFRFLVEELDFRLFGWEANFSATMAINEYVQHGRGDPKVALAEETVHWPYRSESVLDLVEWVRQFNEERDPDDRIAFYGFDMQYPFESAAVLESFLDDVDGESLAEVRDDLSNLADGSIVEYTVSDEKLETRMQAARRVVATLEDVFANNEAEYVEETSRKEVECARQHLRTIAQAVEQVQADVKFRTREKAMAENITWILEHESANRIAIWGHNAHVKRGSVAGGALGTDADAMGEYLHQTFGEEYYALGFDFGQGSVRVHSLPDNAFETYDIETPPQDSIPAVFGEVDCSPFFLDVRSTQEELAVDDWLGSGPRRHNVLGSYEDSPVNYVDFDERDSFDGLVFVDETTPTTPTEQVVTEFDV